MVDIVVAGQIARDVALLVEELPAGGRSVPVRERREMLGGKGANQAVGLAQLGVPVALLGVVGDDEVGTSALAQARGDGVDVDQVIRRAGTRTGLIVDIVDATHHWRYLEDLPEEVLLTESDVAAATELIRTVRAVVVQLQQPSRAALAVARCAKSGGGLVVLDGAPAADAHREPILNAADVLRADAQEAGLLTGESIRTAESALRAGGDLRREHGLRLVALAVAELGDVFVWDGSQAVIPYLPVPVVDTTGAGDAMIAGLTSVLCRGGTPDEAARTGVAAAAATVGHLGGRPNLSPRRIRELTAG